MIMKTLAMLGIAPGARLVPLLISATPSKMVRDFHLPSSNALILMRRLRKKLKGQMMKRCAQLLPMMTTAMLSQTHAPGANLELLLINVTPLTTL